MYNCACVLFGGSQVTSGGLIYRALKDEFALGRKTQFYRILPKGKEADSFGLDEQDVGRMIAVRVW